MVSPVAGLVMVAGGKYTTYRVMAKDAVDAAVHGLAAPGPGLVHREGPDPRRRGLRGGLEPARAAGRDAAGCTSPGSSTCCAATARWSTSCSALVAERPELGEPLESAPAYLKVEAVLRRRRRGCPAPGRPPHPAHPDLHRHLGPGRRPPPRRSPTWSRPSSAGTTTPSAARSSTTAPGSTAELESQQQPDDQTADAARLGAPDVRLGHA